MSKALLQDGPGDDQPAAKAGQPKKKKAKLDAAPAEPAPTASDSESELASEPGDRLSDVELGDEEDVFSPTAPEAEAPHKVALLTITADYAGMDVEAGLGDPAVAAVAVLLPCCRTAARCQPGAWG